MKSKLEHLSKQQGSMLLEALIAILIFSAGILALVGLQAAAIASSTSAKNRTDAAFLADKVIAEMWVDDPTMLSTLYGTTGAKFINWKTEVQNDLPGAIAPTITFAAGSQPTGLKVTVTVLWLLPSEPAGAPPHSYITIAEIKKP